MEQIDKTKCKETGCIFTIDRKKKILKVSKGNPKEARNSILKLFNRKWLPSDLKAIWFNKNPINLFVGIDLTLYLNVKMEEIEQTPRTFSDIISQVSLSD